MPAIGAAAAYKRMRCGFEDSGANIPAKVLGNFGNEVTAVLGNSPGGLELLPSEAYGNHWLLVTHKGQEQIRLPQEGDPCKEIYKLRNPWYRLFNESWINPAGMSARDSSIENTHDLLMQAKAFHAEILHTYHPNTYAHYGAGLNNPAWHRVTWDVGNETAFNANIKDLQILADNRQGSLRVIDPARPKPPGMPTPWLGVRLQPARDPGDQTVPAHSADQQLSSGMLKGVFRQTGYEHQDSYKDEAVLHCTLYSLVRIIQTMSWSK